MSVRAQQPYPSRRCSRGWSFGAARELIGPWGEWRGGVAPPRSLRTVREPLDSYGSHHPAVGFNGLVPLTGSSCCQLARQRDEMTEPLRSAGVHRPRRYYGFLRPCAPHRYAPSREVGSLEGFPSHRDDRFPRSTREPGSDSRRLHAGHHPSRQQGSPRAYPGPNTLPGFDVAEIAFDTSSAVHLRSSS